MAIVSFSLGLLGPCLFVLLLMVGLATGMNERSVFYGLGLSFLASATAIVLGGWGWARLRDSDGQLDGKDLAKGGASLGCAGLLLLLTFMSGTRCFVEETAERNRTVSAHGAIRSALEQYKEKFGRYPSASRSEVYVRIDNQDFDAAGAIMLYQAVLGDGNVFIYTKSDSPAASDGMVSDEERDGIINFSRLPKSIIRKTAWGFMLVDGYGHPFQYTPGSGDSVNPTYDLWSFGKAKPQLHADKAMKINPDIASAWIKNW